MKYEYFPFLNLTILEQVKSMLLYSYQRHTYICIGMEIFGQVFVQLSVLKKYTFRLKLTFAILYLLVKNFI